MLLSDFEGDPLATAPASGANPAARPSTLKGEDGSVAPGTSRPRSHMYPTFSTAVRGRAQPYPLLGQGGVSGDGLEQRKKYAQAAIQHASNSRNIQALKARLEYARWKVENGWTGTSFDRVYQMYNGSQPTAVHGRTRGLAAAAAEDGGRVAGVKAGEIPRRLSSPGEETGDRDQDTAAAALLLSLSSDNIM
ncbi:MAG: hypothetical protein SGCHY_003235 [Lobulomycetales sp.]